MYKNVVEYDAKNYYQTRKMKIFYKSIISCVFINYHLKKICDWYTAVIKKINVVSLCSSDCNNSKTMSSDEGNTKQRRLQISLSLIKLLLRRAIFLLYRRKCIIAAVQQCRNRNVKIARINCDFFEDTRSERTDRAWSTSVLRVFIARRFRAVAERGKGRSSRSNDKRETSYDRETRLSAMFMTSRTSVSRRVSRAKNIVRSTHLFPPDRPPVHSTRRCFVPTYEFWEFSRMQLLFFLHNFVSNLSTCP